MKKLFVLGALAAMLASGTALADTSGKKIAFSNNYAGNSWRQAMLDSYGIANSFEIYSGTHTSNVAFRFQDYVLPFFSKTLSFAPQ